jgi:ABC-type phosphate/phosphonate transport system substrate-binding protein
MKRKIRDVCLLIFTVAAALWLFFPAPVTVGSEKMILRFAFSSMFLSETNRTDTKAAIEIWLRKLGEKKGYTVDSEVKFYDTLEELETAMVKGEVTCMGMMMIDFVKFRHKNLVVPVLSYYKNKSPYETFLLVAHRESGVKSLKDLKKRKIIVEQGKKTFVPYYWLETIVMEDSHLLPKDYFSAVVMEDNPLRTTVPL